MSRSFAAVSLLVAAAAQAGVSLTWQQTREGAAPRTVNIKCEGDAARMETGSASMVSLWQPAQQRLVMLNAEKKVFHVLDAAAGQQLKTARASMQEQREAMRAQMAASMANMPPAQRAKLEAMLAQQDAQPAGAAHVKQPWSFTALGSSSKVGAFSCEQYRATRGDEVVELCVVPWAKAPVKKEDLRCLASLTEFTKGVLADLGGQENTMQDDYSKYPGLPVSSTVTAGGVKRSHTLTQVERATFPADVFAVPAGYTELKPGVRPSKPPTK